MRKEGKIKGSKKKFGKKGGKETTQRDSKEKKTGKITGYPVGRITVQPTDGPMNGREAIPS